METYKNIGIAISTRNRPNAFQKTLISVFKYKPINSKVFVVDDESDNFYSENFRATHQYELYRFSKRQGIPKVKNKCFELMYDAGCSDMFLLDDDIEVLDPLWCDVYVNSGCSHLSYTFLPKKLTWKNFNVFTTSNGCMLYYKKKCLDIVGGMDTEYGFGTFDHPDLSRRIFNAGLTPFPYMDIKGSDKLFRSMDYHNEVERSLSHEERKSQFNKHIQYFNSKAKSKEYIEFRS